MNFLPGFLYWNSVTILWGRFRLHAGIPANSPSWQPASTTKHMSEEIFKWFQPLIVTLRLQIFPAELQTWRNRVKTSPWAFSRFLIHRIHKYKRVVRLVCYSTVVAGIGHHHRRKWGIRPGGVLYIKIWQKWALNTQIFFALFFTVYFLVFKYFIKKVFKDQKQCIITHVLAHQKASW